MTLSKFIDDVGPRLYWFVIVGARMRDAIGSYCDMAFKLPADRVIDIPIVCGSERYDDVAHVMEKWDELFGDSYERRVTKSIKTFQRDQP